MNEKTMQEKFIEDFRIPVGTKNKPYIILLDGYTGMGKTTVAKAIAKIDNSIILNNDEIRHWLNDYQDKTNIKEKLQKYRLELLLKNNNSCIYDSCFCHNWKDKIKYYDKLGYEYYIIRLVCSDEVIKERLSKRTVNKDNYSIATYNDYLWMKENVSHVDDEKISYIINTEENIEDQVKEFILKYSLLEK